MDYFLFLLVNFTLFVRPAELIPELAPVPLYNIFIIAALMAAAPRIMDQLDVRRLAQQPITVCVLGFWIGIMMSHMCRFDTYYTRECGIEFSKTVVYYMLMTAVLNSSARIRSFLYAIAFFTTCNAAVAIAHFYGVINVPSLQVLEYAEMIDPETGAPILFKRMQGTGIFGDPNDLSMIAVMGLLTSIYGFTDKQLGGRKFVWLVPAVVLLATVGLTKSRGGVLALGAALLILSHARYGWWQALAIGALFAPLAAVLTAGRGETMQGGTDDQRVWLWSDGLQLMKTSPVFGIGKGNFEEEIKLSAHNSFVQAYVETGLFGGTLFFGAFVFALWALWNLQKSMKTMGGLMPNRNFERLLPYLVSLVAGAWISMMALTRCYIVPTFMLLGLVNAYFVEAQRHGLPPPLRCSARRFLVDLPIASVAFLFLIRVWVRFRTGGG